MLFQIYLHDDGAEYWLQSLLSASKITKVKIDTNIADGTMGLKAKLNYIVQEKVNRRQFQCDASVTLMNFTDCAFNELKDLECSSIINQVYIHNGVNVCAHLQIEGQ